MSDSFVTTWTVACSSVHVISQVQEYWSGLPFPSPGDLSDLLIEPVSPALAGRFFTINPAGKPFIFLVTLKVSVAQSCPTVCNPMDYSLPGTSVHWIFQARILEWVALSFSCRSSPRPRDWTWVSSISGRLFIIWATREAPVTLNMSTYASHLL